MATNKQMNMVWSRDYVVLNTWLLLKVPMMCIYTYLIMLLNSKLGYIFNTWLSDIVTIARISKQINMPLCHNHILL